MPKRKKRGNPKGSKYLNPSSYASNPGRMRLSVRAFNRISPQYRGTRGLRARIRPKTYFLDVLSEHMMHGDSQPAVVISTDPFRVAAYSDEMDAVAMLGFPRRFLEWFPLRAGDRLLSVNVYEQNRRGEDLIIGPGYMNRYVDFTPTIAEFLVRHPAETDVRKREIGEEAWRRASDLGTSYHKAFPDIYRNGIPPMNMRYDPEYTHIFWNVFGEPRHQ